MKCNQFEEGEIPYGALEKFGLSHEMIEDLPMHVLEDIWNGRQSPVLPIHVTDDEGELIKSRTPSHLSGWKMAKSMSCSIRF